MSANRLSSSLYGEGMRGDSGAVRGECGKYVGWTVKGGGVCAEWHLPALGARDTRSSCLQLGQHATPVAQLLSGTATSTQASGKIENLG